MHIMTERARHARMYRNLSILHRQMHNYIYLYSAHTIGEMLIIACMHALSLSGKYVARGRRRLCKKVLVIEASRAGSGREISKNGSRPQRKNRICYDISQRTLRQAIATPGEHSQGRSS